MQNCYQNKRCYHTLSSTREVEQYAQCIVLKLSATSSSCLRCYLNDTESNRPHFVSANSDLSYIQQL
jgi:hypothetical protein